jgi:hypothetical protein
MGLVGLMPAGVHFERAGFPLALCDAADGASQGTDVSMSCDQHHGSYTESRHDQTLAGAEKVCSGLDARFQALQDLAILPHTALGSIGVWGSRQDEPLSPRGPSQSPFDASALKGATVLFDQLFCWDRSQLRRDLLWRPAVMGHWYLSDWSRHMWFSDPWLEMWLSMFADATNGRDTGPIQSTGHRCT